MMQLYHSRFDEAAEVLKQVEHLSDEKLTVFYIPGTQTEIQNNAKKVKFTQVTYLIIKQINYNFLSIEMF